MISMFIWALALLAIAIDEMLLAFRLLSIRKGKAPEQPFIKRADRILMRICLGLVFLAIVVFSVSFENADIITKLKIFVGCILLTVFQPFIFVGILEHRFLFRQNRLLAEKAMTEDEGQNDE